MHIPFISCHSVLSCWSDKECVYGVYVFCLGRQDIAVITMTCALATVLIYNNPKFTSADLKMCKVQTVEKQWANGITERWNHETSTEIMYGQILLEKVLFHDCNF